MAILLACRVKHDQWGVDWNNPSQMEPQTCNACLAEIQVIEAEEEEEE